MYDIYLITYAILAFLGVLDSVFIYKGSRKKDPLVCPLDFDCNSVLESKWSRVFGIKNDVLGVVYYLVIFSLAIVAFSLPEFKDFLKTLLIFISTGGALYSSYLTYIQVAKIKNFCLYCLASAGISILLFAVALLF